MFNWSFFFLYVPSVALRTCRLLCSVLRIGECGQKKRRRSAFIKALLRRFFFVLLIKFARQSC